MSLQQLEPTLDEKGQVCVQVIQNLFPNGFVSYYRHGVQALAWHPLRMSFFVWQRIKTLGGCDCV
jgi:hypothetical protein